MYTMTGQRTSLKHLAAAQNCRVRGLADRSDGSVAILLMWEDSNSQFYFTTGYFSDLRRAIVYTRDVFETEEIEMNIFKNNKLFPNIRGVMLQDKRITLTMSGKVNIVEMREGGDARVELFFSDHEKTAVVNRTQAMSIAEVYGPETNDWKGRPLVLYGEFGTWFGKQTWGIRVDKDKTAHAARVQPGKNGQGQKEQHKPDPIAVALADELVEVAENKIAIAKRKRTADTFYAAAGDALLIPANEVKAILEAAADYEYDPANNDEYLEYLIRHQTEPAADLDEVPFDFFDAYEGVDAINDDLFGE
jgi:hypothetical protein